MAEQQKQYQTQLEDKKKTLGNKLNVLQDYITKNYAAPVHTIVLSTLIGDENAMTEALKHHSQVPA